jgi:hypothetical protein
MENVWMKEENFGRMRTLQHVQPLVLKVLYPCNYKIGAKIEMTEAHVLENQ